MDDWNANQYLLFERERTRPARDLLAAVPPIEMRTVVDLGCGPGNSTGLLVERFPEAAVIGVDTSPGMLAKAREACPGASFVDGDVASWRPRTAPDLFFANAVLQWVPDHDALLPRLMGLLARGGALAAQMPDNLDEPSHALMREVAASAPFAQKLAQAAAARTALASFETYYDLLRPHAAAVEIWRTIYVHALDGAMAIVEWLKATGLRPFLDPLDPDERTRFIEAYARALETAYPRRSDGRCLLRFPRLFLVAVKR